MTMESDSGRGAGGDGNGESDGVGHFNSRVRKWSVRWRPGRRGL
jgi:hypothetical protein